MNLGCQRYCFQYSFSIHNFTISGEKTYLPGVTLSFSVPFSFKAVYQFTIAVEIHHQNFCTLASAYLPDFLRFTSPPLSSSRVSL
jgi:hypothetical protein